MKPPSDGWDPDERELLESEVLGRELADARERHTLGPDDEQRLLARVMREARPQVTPAAAASRWWIPAAAIAALIVAGTVWMVTQSQSPASPASAPVDSSATVAPPAPEFRLTLVKPDIKISASALAWRGPGAGNPLLADLRPAFDAYRADDYRRADDEFEKLALKYPKSIEVVFHQGIVRLLSGNARPAIASLTAAESLDDSSFAWDVQWYLAIAEERAGDVAAARTRLTRLCGRLDARRQTACDALKKLPV